MTDPILETQELTRRFGGLAAVDALTIAVEQSEAFGLLGANGAGKTTTIKMLTTLLRPTAGRAQVAGFDVVTAANDVRRIIGYVPQAISVDGTLTGYENLLVFARLYDIPRREQKPRMAEALAFMGLSDAANRLVREYSGGMIRRLEIAQSTLHRPPVLFLDEPTVGLDPLARKAVWDHLHQLRTEHGTTIFFTTHYMEEAEAHCSRVAIMHQGKLAVLGTPAELKSSLRQEGGTLDDVFVRYAGTPLESGGNYGEVSSERRTASRLG
ncbi:MAG: ATP-binding cassette domain-containing protein [Verrucomicrobia bacterium]|nr:ATP-binding cassette domain-containing protein [Verrucomicrobiota bacterium]